MNGDSDLITSTLARQGWQMGRASAGWRMAHPARGEAFLSFTPSWVCLAALLPQAITAAVPAERLARALLMRNEAIFMAKFSRDPAGQFVVQVELPITGALNRLEAALAALLRYGQDVEALVGGEGDSADPADRVASELYFAEPPGLPAEMLAYYLHAVEPRGWWVRSQPKGLTWPLVYKGQRSFPAYLTVSRAWACFQVLVLSEVPALAPATDTPIRQAFLDYMLRVNDSWFMAKVGLDEQGRVLAMVEVPTLELDFETFRQVMGLLATYLDLYAREIQIMAHLPSDARLAERVVV